VPPLVVHGYRNASDADVRFLNVHAPGAGFAAYLRALRDGAPHDFDQHPPPDDGGRPASDAAIGRGEIVDERDGVRVARLADAAEVAIAEVTMQPGASAAVAPGESLYVLDGALALAAGEGPSPLAAGMWLTPRAGGAGEVRAAGAEAARFLRLRAPNPGVP
jgi:quercetin dioxygenase-like cupin family protein